MENNASQNEKKKKEKISIDERLSRYGMTKKSAYSASTIAITIALIIVLSVVQATFNPAKLQTVAYWVSLAIQIAICMLGMVCGKQIGDDNYHNMLDGEFRVELGKYKTAMDRVIADGLFAFLDDWLEQYRLKKLKNKKEMILQDAGISQMEVLDLSLSELEFLKDGGYYKNWANTPYYQKYFVEGMDRSETYFVDYTDEQIETIRACKTGKVKVSRLPKSFFVDAFSQTDVDMWESSAHAAKKKGLMAANKYAYKIASLVAVSVLTTALEPMIEGGIDQAEMWFTMISRLWTLAMAILWGYYMGIDLGKVDVAYLRFKTSIMMQCHEEYENKMYVPMSVGERAKAQYQERLMKKTAVTVVPGMNAREVKKNE